MNDLSTYIFDVRRELSDVPEDYMTDIQVFQGIEQAYQLVTKLVDTDTDDTYRAHCIVMLAAYYAYLSYTSLAETMLGTLPVSAAVRLRDIRKKAYVFISMVSSYNLDNDFNIIESKSRPIANAMTQSVGAYDSQLD